MRLDYREYEPSAPLAAYVECFWTLRGAVASSAPPERVLPDGCWPRLA